jgi:hypothetical protein
VKKTLLLTAALLLCSACGHAASLEYTGTFTDPNQLFQVQFTLTQTTTVTAETFSWRQGNFDPVVWLFTSTFQQITKNDDICNGQGCSPVNRDSMISATIGPGTYVLAMTTFDQHWWVYGAQGTPSYVKNTGWSYMGDFSGLPRNYDLVFTTSTTIATPTTGLIFPPRDDTAPEPGTMLLLAAGGALLAWRRFKKRRPPTPRSG